MKNARTVLTISTLAGLTLCGLLAARITSAQGPGDQGPGGQGPGGGFGGGRGRFGGAPPFATGTITGGDANSGRITIQSQFNGNAQTIQVTNSTPMVTQATVAITDLQVNDQVQVQGVPTGITASSITAGQMPEFLNGGGRFGGGRFGGRFGGGPGGPGGPGGNPENGNPGGQAVGGQAGGSPAFASATGKVTATTPLTISLGNDVSLTIKPGANARITKITPITINDLKVGDRIVAAGQTGADGTFTATGVGVNMEMGVGFGMGGPGGFGGRRGRRSADQ